MLAGIAAAMGESAIIPLWSVADLLRGNFKQSEYGRVILPFTILRRLDGVLEATKPQVLKEYAAKQHLPPAALERFLVRAAGFPFYNISPFTFTTLLGDAANVRANLATYVASFSDNVRDIFERFELPHHPRPPGSGQPAVPGGQKSSPTSTCTPRWSATPDGRRVRGADPQVRRTLQRDRRRALHPARGHPPDGQLLFIEDDEALTQPGVVRTIYDPTAAPAACSRWRASTSAA
jgi:type I restriction enzyme M protein